MLPLRNDIYFSPTARRVGFCAISGSGGYAKAANESSGQATVYSDATHSGPGEVAVPDVDSSGPDETPPQYTHTSSHWVPAGDNMATGGGSVEGEPHSRRQT